MNTFKNIKDLIASRKGKIMLCAVAAVTTLVMLMSVMIIRRNDVKIYVDGQQVFELQTLSDNSELWIQKSGINVGQNDRVTVKDTEVFIDRAVFVTVFADGEQVTFYAVKDSVANVLKSGGIEYSDADIITPALDTKVLADAKITVERVTVKEVTETEIVKHETQKIKTNDLYEGQKEVVTEGKDGKILHTYSVKYIDGVESERTLLSSETVEEAVTEVVRVGTKIKSSFLKTSSTPTNYVKAIAMTATAYTYGSDGGNYTCLGQKTARGIVAVDPKVIPLGTKLYIESADGKYIYGTAVAGDTGGAIKGNKIDLFVESKSECRAFGRRTVNVYILE